MIAFASLDSYLENVRERIERGPYTKPLQEAIELAHRRMEKTFTQATSPGGKPWPPHAETTVRLYGPHPLLILSGAMKASTVVGGPDHIERVEPFTAYTGTKDRKAIFHQQGTKRMPQREFHGVDDETADKMAEALADFLTEMI